MNLSRTPRSLAKNVAMALAMSAALLIPLALPATALAQPAGGPAQSSAAFTRPVSIQMMVVHATDSRPGLDTRLESLKNAFAYFKYKGYWLLSAQQNTIAVGDSTTFSVEGGRRVKVTLVSVDEQRARVRVEMSNKDGKLLDTTVSINRNGTFVVAGPRYEDGILMLPLRASY